MKCGRRRRRKKKLTVRRAFEVKGSSADISDGPGRRVREQGGGCGGGDDSRSDSRRGNVDIGGGGGGGAVGGEGGVGGAVVMGQEHGIRVVESGRGCSCSSHSVVGRAVGRSVDAIFHFFFYKF